MSGHGYNYGTDGFRTTTGLLTSVSFFGCLFFDLCSRNSGDMWLGRGMLWKIPTVEQGGAAVSVGNMNWSVAITNSSVI